MSKRAEELSAAYTDARLELLRPDIAADNYTRGRKMSLDIFDGNEVESAYEAGFEQAEKDLTPAFEFSFDVPDNDGHIVFTPMDNMTIRKELKLKKGERVIVSIRKEHEKE